MTARQGNLARRRRLTALWAVALAAGLTCNLHPNKALGEWDQVAKLIAPDAAASDYFGHSVSVSGDRIVVGAYGADTGPDHDVDGAAYAFRRDASGWAYECELPVNATGTTCGVGTSVAVDGVTAVVGAVWESGSGAAHVLERGSSWVETAKLLPSDGNSGDQFGGGRYCVDISGNSVVVGSQFNDWPGPGAWQGAAYVYEWDGTAWGEVANLTAPDGADSDYLGTSCAMCGDFVIAGASGDDDNGNMTGSANVFERTTGGWTHMGKLVASDPAAIDRFGKSCAISEDYAVVGSPHDDDRGDNSGSVYVFERSGTTWSEMAKLTASDGVSDDQFGISVDIWGEFIVVGAYQKNSTLEDDGAAYVFRLDGDEWVEVAKLTADSPQAARSFGRTVSIDNGMVVVGAELDSYAADRAGAAYIYEIPEPATLSLLVLGGLALIRRRRR